MKVGLFYFAPRVESKFNTNYFPNNLGYLASYLEQNNRADVFIEYKVADLMQKRPDIIGISSYTETYNESIKLAGKIKEYLNVPVIIGGHHISNLPQKLDPIFSAGVIGEGEEVMSELVKTYQLKGDFLAAELGKIEGLVFYENNQVKLNQPAKAINPLDKIPPPLRKLSAGMDGKLEHYLITARGCPFRCIYCAAGLAMESVRYHSIDRVMFEMEEIIRNYPEQEFISIKDDLFAMNKKRLKEICQRVREAGLHKKVKFSCNARASCFDEEIALILRDMNVKIIGFGLESANDRVLKYLKGSSSVAKNQQALDLCEKYNIATYAHFIVGNPTEKISETADTYWFVRKNSRKLWQVNLRVATPLPGTDLWHLAIREKLISENFSAWETMDLWFTPERSVYLNQEYSAEVMHKEVIPVLEELVTGKVPLRNTDLIYNHFNAIFGSNFETILEITDAEDKLTDYYSFPDFRKLKTKNGYLPLNEITENKKFSLILLTESLSHLRFPLSELKKLKLLLQEKGQLGIIFFNPKYLNFIVNLYQSISPEYQNRILDNQSLNFLTLPKILDYLQKLDLKVKKCFPVLLENSPDLNFLRDNLRSLLNNFQQKELDYPLWYILSEK